MRSIFISALLGLGLVGCQMMPSQTAHQSGATTMPATAPLTLESAYWVFDEAMQRPVKVNGQISVELGEPHLRFNAAQRQLSGYTGCNRLVGTYEQAGNQLKLQAGATRRLCHETAEVENRVTNAINLTQRYQVEGEKLVLLDDKNQVVARLHAVWL